MPGTIRIFNPHLHRHHASVLPLGVIHWSRRTRWRAELALGPFDLAPELPVNPRVKSLLLHSNPI
jgi:hypothetical protein